MKQLMRVLTSSSDLQSSLPVGWWPAKGADQLLLMACCTAAGSWRCLNADCTNAADRTTVQKHQVEAAVVMSQPEQSSNSGGVAAAGVLQGGAVHERVHA
jgi:hypothetical protein